MLVLRALFFRDVTSLLTLGESKGLSDDELRRAH